MSLQVRELLAEAVAERENDAIEARLALYEITNPRDVEAGWTGPSLTPVEDAVERLSNAEQRYGAAQAVLAEFDATSTGEQHEDTQ